MNWFGFLILFGLAYAVLVVLMTARLYRELRRPSRFTYAAALGRGFVTDPSELGLVAEDVRLLDASGKGTSAWVIEGELAGGPTVLMLHGFGRSRFSTLEHAPTLARFAGRLVVVDLPGHGESEAGSSFAGVTEYRDVLGFVEQTRRGDEPVVLYGRSMGSGVAIAAAAHGGGVIAGVIGEGAYRTWHDPIRRRLRLQKMPAEPMVTLVGWLYRCLVGGLGGFDRAVLSGHLRCPLLLMHGTEDAVCAFDDARLMVEAAEFGELVAFEGGRHLDLHTIDPQLHRDTIDRFMRGVIGSA